MSVRSTGTINCDAVTPQGDISSVTTTSGLAFKIPGRVGDSPIIGAGQYTDNDVGAAGSTGRGESNIKVCGGFLTVEFMRRGMKPTDACLDRKSTRLNSSHSQISYAVFCLKKKKQQPENQTNARTTTHTSYGILC